MKAIIFNSGLGKRMGELTENNHKSMVVLNNGETVFERQIRILKDNGIKDIIVTVGPFKEKLIEVSKKFTNVNFTFVENAVYDKTNYIYSMYLASKYIDDDFLLMHGDLVFNEELVTKMLNYPEKSICLINENKQLPEKDFKGRIVNGKLKEVSINIFDDNCFAFQPLYKLDKDTITAWKKKIDEFVNLGNTGVYAENALNEITEFLNIYPISYANDYIDEIDNVEDYERVKKEIESFEMKDKNVELTNSNQITEILNKNKACNLFIVTPEFLIDNQLVNEIRSACPNITFFTEFSANPLYEEVVAGIKKFKDNNCDFIISIGGGSAIDVAKCIKAFLPMEESINYLEQPIRNSSIKHLAIPTTAGTGSESTHFAVVYYNKLKQSVEDNSVLPDYILLDSRFLKSLPLYQKKSTMLDALCQGIESYWSVNATEKSRRYAREAIRLILDNYKQYILEDSKSYDNIMKASNYSGKAINISKTTAAHAMSYKITSLYGISHGHAVAMCLPYVWNYMIENMTEDLEPIFNEIDQIFKTNSHKESLIKFINIYNELDIDREIKYNEDDIDILTNSVNEKRLNNNPIKLEKPVIENIYRKILK